MLKMVNVLEEGKKDYTKYYVKLKPVFILILICAFVLLLPYIFRGEHTLLGKEGYYHARIGEVGNYDELSYGGRENFDSYGWGFVVFILSSVTSLSVFYISRLLPFLLGLLGIGLFYLILNRLKIDKKLIIISCLVLIISPVFIDLFFLSSYYTASIILSLLAFYLYLRKKFILTGIVFLLMPFFGIFSSLISLFLLLVYVLMNDKKNIKLFFVFLLLVGISLGFKYYSLLSYGFPDILYFKEFFGRNLISDFGSEIGLSMFAVILAFLTVILNWKKGYRFMLIFSVIFSMFLLSFLFRPFIIYLNFILAVFISVGLISIINKKWESNIIKNFSILILIFGLIFSGLSHLTVLSRMDPNQDIFDSLVYLNGNSNSNDIILSHYSNGFWISSLADRKVVMDSNFFYAPNLNEVSEEVNELFYSREFDRSNELIDKYSIDYVWITNDMKEGLVWNNEEEGLLFILEFGGDFMRVYRNDEVEIWKRSFDE